MRARGFDGYGDLELVDLPKPDVANGRVLVRMAAAGVTPLDHTILSGQFPRAKAPLVLGNEGAGVVQEGGGTEFPAGSRVMFAGPYGVSKMGPTANGLRCEKRRAIGSSTDSAFSLLRSLAKAPAEGVNS
jgi:NADPH2:quinone reductase